MKYTSQANAMSSSGLWIFMLCGILFLHFVLVRVPLIPFPIFYLFGVPLALIIVKGFLIKPKRFLTKTSIEFLMIFGACALWLGILKYVYGWDPNYEALYRQAYKSIIIYLAIVGFCVDIRQAERIVRFSAVILVMSSLLALLVVLYGGVFDQLRNLLIIGLTPDELVTTSLTAVGSHSSGLSANRHYFPYHLCFALFPCMYFYFASSGNRRLFWFLAIVIIIFSGLSTGGRSLVVSWLAGGVYLMFTFSRKYFRIRRVFIVVLTVAIVSVVSYNVIPNNTIKRHFESMKYGYHTSRLGLQMVAWNLLVDYPLGPSDNRERFQRSYSKFFNDYVDEGRPTSLHNSFLYIVTEGGVIGLLIVIIFFTRLFALLNRRDDLPPRHRLLRDALRACLIAVVTNSFFHNSGFFVGEGTTFLCLALLCSRVFRPPTLISEGVYEKRNAIL